MKFTERICNIFTNFKSLKFFYCKSLKTGHGKYFIAAWFLIVVIL